MCFSNDFLARIHLEFKERGLIKDNTDFLETSTAHGHGKALIAEMLVIKV